MNPLGVILDVLCVAGWLPITAIAIFGGALVGIVGLFIDKQHKVVTLLISLLIMSVGTCMLLIFVRDKYFPEPPPTPEPVYGLTDEAVQPFLLAINQSDRLALGFSPIPKEAKVIIQEYQSSTAMTYIFIGPDSNWGTRISWHIYFDKIGDTYRWDGEDEIYAGPHQDENIYIRYSIDSGANYYTKREPLPQNTLVVEYRGEDRRLLKQTLTLDDIRPIIIEWKNFWDNSQTYK